MVRKSLLKELLNRRVPQIMGSYFIAGTSLIFFIQYLIDRYEFPPHYSTLALFALIGILPSVVILSYFHGAPGKDEWSKLEKYGIPTNILFIAAILVVSFRYDYWQVEISDKYIDPKKVLLHITSLEEYVNKYQGRNWFTYVKGRKLIPLADNELDKIRKNVESLLLGEFINEPIEIIIPTLQDQVEFLNQYHLLSFNDTSFSNVTTNYERFNFDDIHYINIYQYQNEPTYFFRKMKWRNLPHTFTNGSEARAEITNIEKEIFNIIMEQYIGSGTVGVVSSIKDDIIYIKLNNLNVKENMNLEGGSIYDYTKNGRKDRLEDLNKGITHLENRTDSVSRVQLNLYKDEIISIQDGIGFNWFYSLDTLNDKIDTIKNTRSFTMGFDYTLKVIDFLPDSIAVTKVIELRYPYVKIRIGDRVWVD